MPQLPVRLCEVCKQTKSLSEYRNIRDFVCFECIEKREEERRIEKDLEDAKLLMEKALKIKNAGSPDVMPSLSQLAAKIVSRFGGLDGFVDSWFDQFKTALESRPGAVSNLQHFNQIAKIISEAQKHEREDELANMTMEQIEQEQRRLMMMDLIQSLGEEAKGELSRKILGIVGSKNQEPLPIDGTVEVVHE